MSYDKLHNGLTCDCLTQEGVRDEPESDFVRSIPKKFISMDHLASYHERGWKPRYPLNSDKTRCKWRGLSINKLNENRPQIREYYQHLKATAPMGFDFEYVCIFRVRTETAKVWPTPSRTQPSHYSLLKSDEFDISSLDIAEIVPLTGF